IKTLSPENPPQKHGKQSQPKKYSKTKNRHKNKKQTHYRVHKQHPHICNSPEDESQRGFRALQRFRRPQRNEL
ncbi:hypothetical protein, partial [Actinomyces sp. ph3]|uniref:hypothetical protein n=1 Tax=Actinomyces sp. ph3 TaxID=1118058 RepID=UPI001F46CBEC